MPGPIKITAAMLPPEFRLSKERADNKRRQNKRRREYDPRGVEPKADRADSGHMLYQLPYPPAINSCYDLVVRGKRAVKIRSRSYEAWLGIVHATLRRGGVAFGKDRGPLMVRILANVPTRASDCDGPIKPTLDCLNGIAYEDDNQVEEVGCARITGRTPCLLVSVYPINP